MASYNKKSVLIYHQIPKYNHQLFQVITKYKYYTYNIWQNEIESKVALTGWV